MSTLTEVPDKGNPTVNTNRCFFMPVLTSSILPSGMLIPYAGIEIPNGWLFCDGSEVSRTEYADLFKVIGIIYGEGDGTTTFNLPNFVDRFMQGSTTPGTYKEAGLPNITGKFSVQGNQSNNIFRLFSGAFILGVGTASNYAYINAPQGTSNHRPAFAEFDASRSNATYGKANTVQPPAVTVKILIKT